MTARIVDVALQARPRQQVHRHSCRQRLGPSGAHGRAAPDDDTRREFGHRVVRQEDLLARPAEDGRRGNGVGQGEAGGERVAGGAPCEPHRPLAGLDLDVAHLGGIETPHGQNRIDR